MISQDLVAAVEDGLSQGQSPDEIKESLLSEGWSEEAIDSVFEEKSKQKEPSAWEQTPFYQHYLHLDKKYAHLPARVVFGIAMGLVLFIVLIAFILYKATDPFNLDGVSRDNERTAVYEQLQTALQRYHDDKNTYPADLSGLVPDYVKYVPRDPRINKQYTYSFESANDYKLCVYFETKPQTEDCYK